MRESTIDRSKITAIRLFSSLNFSSEYDFGVVGSETPRDRNDVDAQEYTRDIISSCDFIYMRLLRDQSHSCPNKIPSTTFGSR